MLKSCCVIRTIFGNWAAAVGRHGVLTPYLVTPGGKETLLKQSPISFLPHQHQKRFIRLTSPTLCTPLKTDYYELLGVRREATLQEIKMAYIQHAKQNHPDANPDDPEASAKFQAAAEAYEVLSDEEKRANYDAFGMDGLGSNGDKEGKEKRDGTKQGSSVFGDFVDDDEFQVSL